MFAAVRLGALLRVFRTTGSVTNAFPRTPNRGRRAMSMATSPSAQPFLLYTWRTPNGMKVAILLEELKAVYGLQYDVHPVNISNNIQKQPWFISLNPNGRVPVLVDRTRNDFAVFETAAILLYLERHYDPTCKFSFDRESQPDEWSRMLQWIFFAHGGIGPMQGQLNHFARFASEDIPYAKKRYLDETKRLYGVLDIRLTDRDWLAGSERGTYSVADMNAFPWVAIHSLGGIDSLDEWPNVKAWVERCSERPAVRAGLQIP